MFSCQNSYLSKWEAAGPCNDSSAPFSCTALLSYLGAETLASQFYEQPQGVPKSLTQSRGIERKQCHQMNCGAHSRIIMEQQRCCSTCMRWPSWCRLIAVQSTSQCGRSVRDWWWNAGNNRWPDWIDDPCKMISIDCSASSHYRDVIRTSGIFFNCVL